jgi:Ca-activated chloride channel family protein
VRVLEKHPGATNVRRTWHLVGRFARIAILTLVPLTSAHLDAREEDKRPSPCTEDAMLVLDASGSMSGNQELGVANSKARIDEVRSALSHVLPTATKNRKVGLITYGPGSYNQCYVKLEFEPMPYSAVKIMRSVNSLVPAGKTPLTSAVEQAAEVLQYRIRPGVIVVLTDGEETCGGSPCGLGKQLRSLANRLTVHVIAFRYENFSWTGANTAMELACLADENRGLYVKANSERDLIEALGKTLDCPMISLAPWE